MRVSWHYPAGLTDTLFAGVRLLASGFILDGRMGKTPVRMELTRTP